LAAIRFRTVRDAHGTEAAALISARANGVCGAGVAPLSMLAGGTFSLDPLETNPAMYRAGGDTAAIRELLHRDEGEEIAIVLWAHRPFAFPSNIGIRCSFTY